MPTRSWPVGSVSCRMPALTVDKSVDPPTSSQSAYVGICDNQGSERTSTEAKNDNETKHSNDGNPRCPQASVSSAKPKDSRILWVATSPVSNEEKMAARAADTVVGSSRYAQRSGSRKSGKVEQLSRTANKEWLYSLRARLDNLLGGASALKKTQAVPPLGFRIRASALTLFRHDETAQAERQHNKGFIIRVREATQEQQRTAQQAQRQYDGPEQPAQQPGAAKHWFDTIERRPAARAFGGMQVESQLQCVQAGSYHDALSGAAPTEDVRLFPRGIKAGGLSPLPLLEMAAARYGLDKRMRAQQPFLGMEENDVAFQSLLGNYYALRLSPVPQEVSLKLVV